ncbi:hypothetical protein PsWM33_03517 [Pseudovibrio sp. WM33]|nr:hypothetical protein PsWM33_03517 [Pseudovibrio sp. WM33]
MKTSNEELKLAAYPEQKQLGQYILSLGGPPRINVNLDLGEIAIADLTLNIPHHHHSFSAGYPCILPTAHFCCRDHGLKYFLTQITRSVHMASIGNSLHKPNHSVDPKTRSGRILI